MTQTPRGEFILRMSEIDESATHSIEQKSVMMQGLVVDLLLDIRDTLNELNGDKE